MYIINATTLTNKIVQDYLSTITWTMMSQYINIFIKPKKISEF